MALVRAAVVFFGLVAAVLVAGFVALVFGPAAAGAALGVLLLVAILAARARSRRVLAGFVLCELLLAGAATAAIALGLLALTGPGLPPQQADAAALAAAQSQLDALAPGPFRIELTEAELTAVVQDRLARNPDAPVRSVTLDILDADATAPGRIAFTARFRNGPLTATGVAVAAIADGQINLELRSVEVGELPLPGVGTDAVESLLDDVADLNAALLASGATIDEVTLAGDRIVVAGTATQVVTTEGVLDVLEDATAPATTRSTPQERLGPGDVDALEAPGTPLYLALGDSLAANVGVASPRDGYVSRLHRQLVLRDGVGYGLRNLGRSGETAATMRSGGQLDAALQVIVTTEVALITIDVGANELLGQLAAAPCADAVDSPACQQQLDTVIAAYREELDAVLAALRQAAGVEVEIVFLLAYNPFSLGAATPQEVATDAALGRLNAAAVEVAGAHGVLVADGATPMRGTAAATTHLLDATPDIHPNTLGYDVLAAALLEALS